MDRLIYKLDITKTQMIRIGFIQEYGSAGCIYRFPVYRYNDIIPIAFCKLWIDEETQRVWYNVCGADDAPYPPYYDSECSHNAVRQKIDSAISAELNRLGAVKVG